MRELELATDRLRHLGQAKHKSAADLVRDQPSNTSGICVGGYATEGTAVMCRRLVLRMTPARERGKDGEGRDLILANLGDFLGPESNDLHRR